MSVASFNTHAFVKRLTAAGMPEAQAEALAEELTPLVEERLATKDDLAKLATKADLTDLKAATRVDLNDLRVATKADLSDLKAATKADLSDLKATTKADIAEAKADLIKWTFGAIGFQTVIILGAVVALARASH